MEEKNAGRRNYRNLPDKRGTYVAGNRMLCRNQSFNGIDIRKPWFSWGFTSLWNKTVFYFVRFSQKIKI